MSEALSSDLVLAPTEMQAREVRKAAIISPCRKYRYRLWRQWDWNDRKPVMWLMLNPSTADASIDDPTIRRCIEFTRRWGYGAMWVGNLYAYRSTDPSALYDLPYEEAVGPDNFSHLDVMARESALVVCAWGNHGAERRHGPPACEGGWWHLGRTSGGQPKHPLARGKAFISYDQPLLRYSA